jgi:hypothetical protein
VNAGSSLPYCCVQDSFRNSLGNTTTGRLVNRGESESIFYPDIAVIPMNEVIENLLPYRFYTRAVYK